MENMDDILEKRKKELETRMYDLTREGAYLSACLAVYQEKAADEFYERLKNVPEEVLGRYNKRFNIIPKSKFLYTLMCLSNSKRAVRGAALSRRNIELAVEKRSKRMEAIYGDILSSNGRERRINAINW